MKNFKITIEYDGTNYHGWQRQKNENTIQAEIEKAIKRITKQSVNIAGSGRTDASAHAFGQVASFSSGTKIEAKNLKKALNSVLPNDIVIHDCKIVPNDFHARFSAKSKIYNYVILNRESETAIFNKKCWFIKKRLNIAEMQKAALMLIGDHDFKAFEGAGSPRKSSVRTVFDAKIIRKNYYIIFEIKASGFLKHMVRNIIGTLVDVGLAKIDLEDFRNIFDSRDRTKAGITAPAFGLFLMKVFYYSKPPKR